MVKQAEKIRTNNFETNPSSISKYLFEYEKNRDDKFSLSKEGFIKAFEHLSARLTLSVYDRLKALINNNYSYEEAWNLTSIDWIKVIL